MHYFEVQ